MYMPQCKTVLKIETTGHTQTGSRSGKKNTVTIFEIGRLHCEKTRT